MRGQPPALPIFVPERGQRGVTRYVSFCSSPIPVDSRTRSPLAPPPRLYANGARKRMWRGIATPPPQFRSPFPVHARRGYWTAGLRGIRDPLRIPAPHYARGTRPPPEDDDAAKATVATTRTGDGDDAAAAGMMTGPMAAAGSEAGTMVAIAAAKTATRRWPRARWGQMY
jgi:hypothetical protein